MIVLLTGASGFIGGRLLAALVAAGHEVACALRDPATIEADWPSVRCIRVDFAADSDPTVWVPRLAGIDAVINAVGILRETNRQRFEQIHVLTPRALFAACVTAGVGRVIQISALGADEHASSAYHLSKRRADEFLEQLPLDWTIVQPSLVYGSGGTSARLFTTLASLPVIPLPGHGEQLVQPVHIDDLIEVMLIALSGPHARRQRLAVVGPAALQLREFLRRLRLRLELGDARFFPVPLAIVRATARLGRHVSGLLDPDTLAMLMRGNTADAAPITRVLGRQPRSADKFIPAAEARAARIAAQLNWLLPILRVSIATVWIATGIVSLAVYPRAASYALLGQVGIPGALAPTLLVGAGLMDLAFGFATLLMRRRRILWLAQIAAIVFYTLVITIWLPQFWAHPFGPLLKNLPMLAGIWLLCALENR